MSNSEVSEVSINWAEEANAPLSSWADEMDEIDALPSSSSYTRGDDSQMESSLKTDEVDTQSSTRELRSPEFNDRASHADMPRSDSNSSLSRSFRGKDSSSDLSGSVSVKEQIPFPTVAPFVAFISNVHLDASQEDISKSLQPITGTPKSVKIILNKETSRPRGFCYVEFEDAIGLKAAIDADGLEVLGQSTHIVVAEQKKESKASLRNSFSNLPRRESSRQNKPEHQDTRSKQPRTDSASQLSRGRFDSSASYGPRKESSRFQTQKSNSFSAPRAKSYSKFPEGSMNREFRSSKPVVLRNEEKSMSVGNMFTALQSYDEM